MFRLGGSSVDKTISNLVKTIKMVSAEHSSNKGKKKIPDMVTVFG